MSRETFPSLDRIAAALDASEQSVAAGHLVPASKVHAMLQEGVDEIKARMLSDGSLKVQRLRR